MKMILAKATADARQKGEPMSDLISREAVIQVVYDGTYLSLEKRHALVDMIDRMPALERKGKWLHPYQSNIASECSVCHVQMPISDYFYFCPHCGTRMKENG